MSGKQQVNDSPNGKRQTRGDEKVGNLIREDPRVDSVQGQNVGEGIHRNHGNEAQYCSYGGDAQFDLFFRLFIHKSISLHFFIRFV